MGDFSQLALFGGASIQQASGEERMRECPPTED